MLWLFLKRTSNNVRWIYLIIASFIFYGWWDWRFLFLMSFSGLTDFFAGLGMARFPKHKKLLLALSITANLGSLCTFKYLDFGINNVNWLFKLFGVDIHMPNANLILPIGISFYTFQSLSYTIDVYRGDLAPTKNILHFFAFLSLFPQLVAGPIVRAKILLPQLMEAKPVTEQQRWDGLNLIAFGFFKKVVVADTLAAAVNQAFGNPAANTYSSYWWVIMIMFAFQIYCDFSGYSDIAIGLGKWLGYEFTVNFRNPYIATSFREFWQRWHISLSTWFRDYVYFPLGGSRKGEAKGHINMWITMLTSGFWHGASWHFVIWAGLHSFYLSLERVTQWPQRIMKLSFGRHITVFLVFVMTVIAWVFFRAQSIPQAMQVLGNMFNFSTFDVTIIPHAIKNTAINVLLLMIGSQLFFHLGWDKAKWTTSQTRLKGAFDSAFIASVILISVFMRAPGNTFIYFQF
jgi:D-alanyl-lipoteichoic acid acyltransferase DltB (MBOAT superfamily)